VPNGVPEWRAFKDEPVFDAAMAAIPSLGSWTDPRLVEPITGVLAMAGLRNSLRDASRAVEAGVVPVGDALAHTDPVLAHGLAFALIGAKQLADSLRRHPDVAAAGTAYLSAVLPLIDERFALSSALDAQRRRMWVGEPVDFAHADGDYVLFTTIAGAVAGAADPEIFRVFLRRITLLDSTDVLDGDRELQRRIEETFARMMSTPRPAAGPTRAEMVSLVSAHG